MRRFDYEFRPSREAFAVFSHALGHQNVIADCVDREWADRITALLNGEMEAVALHRLAHAR